MIFFLIIYLSTNSGFWARRQNMTKNNPFYKLDFFLKTRDLKSTCDFPKCGGRDDLGRFQKGR
jgi:hypothetical protein